MGKIVLYYKYIDIEHPKRIMKWQQKICQELQLRGRILIAHEGINGTVGGTQKNIERYIEIMRKNPLFADVDFKESPGDADCFPRLQVTVKDEVVRLGLDPQHLVASAGGELLDPQQAHELMNQKPDDLVILDARNTIEWKIGRFTHAITPDIDHFRELPNYIDNNLEQFKDKQVLMYCTGGIRCERASAYLQSKGIAKQVFQLKGGIHRYVEQYPDGFFRGKNYVFDSRIAVKVTDDVLSSCQICNASCDEYTNCLNALCNKHFICCSTCLKQYNNTCSTQCQKLIQTKKVNPRPAFNHAQHNSSTDTVTQ